MNKMLQAHATAVPYRRVYSVQNSRLHYKFHHDSSRNGNDPIFLTHVHKPPKSQNQHGPPLAHTKSYVRAICCSGSGNLPPPLLNHDRYVDFRSHLVVASQSNNASLSCHPPQFRLFLVKTYPPLPKLRRYPLQNPPDYMPEQISLVLLTF